MVVLRRSCLSACAQYNPYIVDKVDAISVVQADENTDYLRGKGRIKGIPALIESVEAQ